MFQTTDWPPAQDDLFPQQHEAKAEADAKQHVDEIVMTGIDCRPADAQRENAQQRGDNDMGMPLQGIKEGAEAIGAMQGGHGCKDIGITAVDAMEDRRPDESIKTCQAGLAA